MHILSPQYAEDFINGRTWNFNRVEGLTHPIDTISVARRSDLSIEIRATSQLVPKQLHHQRGAFTPNGVVEMSDEDTCSVEISGMYLRGQTTSFGSNGPLTTQVSHAASIDAAIQDETVGEYLIEWLENLGISGTLWPEQIEFQSADIEEITLDPSDEYTMTITGPSITEGGSVCCISLEIGSQRLYLVDLKKRDLENSTFIMYRGMPSEEVRARIRSALSFCLGSHLITLGHIVVDSAWKPCSFRLTHGNAIGDKGSMFPPPIDLSIKKGRSPLCKSKLANLANAIYKSHETYGLDAWFWMYWHAKTAPYHVAGVQWGACLEALQRAYKRNNKKTFSSVIIEDKAKRKKLLNALRKTLTEITSGWELSEQQEEWINNNLSNVNTLSQPNYIKKLFDRLSMDLSQEEMDAWGARNEGAHGRLGHDSVDFRKTLENITVLEVLVHRLFLRIIGANTYTDYTCNGSQERGISQAQRLLTSKEK